MKSSIRMLGVVAATAVVVIAAAVMLPHPTGAASSQHTPMRDQGTPGQDVMPDMQRHQQLMQMHGQGTAPTGVTLPTMPGQDAFGAIQEIVRILEADPATDWSKVDLKELRQHLIDMNEVTLNADAAATPIEGGVVIAVTGSGRTLAAIRRMVTAHAREIDGQRGWKAKTEALPNGVLLTVTSTEAKEVAHIRGLGFMGLLVTGSHHQLHHLAMAKGEFVHAN
jgi:hypothetical protein